MSKNIALGFILLIVGIFLAHHSYLCTIWKQSASNAMLGVGFLTVVVGIALAVRGW